MTIKRCKFCRTETPDEFGFLEIRGYDWGSNDEDALSFQKTTGHRCANVGGCAERVLAQPTVDGLQMIITEGRDNLGGLVDQAQETFADYSKIVRETAIANDAAAREQGRGGAIGGGF